MFHLTSCAITYSQIKYCMASTSCLTNLDTMLQKIMRRAVVEFYNFSSCFTCTVQEPHPPFLEWRKSNSRYVKFWF